MGEAFGRWQLGPDEEIMKHIDVANVACGFHASDPVTLHKSKFRDEVLALLTTSLAEPALVFVQQLSSSQKSIT